MRFITKGKRIVEIGLFNIAAVLFLLGSIELFSYLVIKTSEKKTPDLTTDQNWNFVLHPSVGITHSRDDFLRYSQLDNFSVLGDNLALVESIKGTGSAALNILTLGGSTTDPLGTQFSGFHRTWPTHLGKILSKSGLFSEVNIINAAIGSATSGNELIRLISALYTIQPDEVISYNGLNEIYFEEPIFEENNLLLSHKNALNSFSSNLTRTENSTYYKCYIFCIESSYLYRLAKNTIASNQKSIGITWRIAGIKPSGREWFFQDSGNVDIEHDNSALRNKLLAPITLSKTELAKIERAAKIWHDNVTKMNAISNLHDSNYTVFVQPIYGIGMTRDQIFSDSIISRDPISNTITARRIGIDYLMYAKKEKMEYLYKKILNHCSNLTFCVDATKLRISSDQTMHKNDLGHPNSGGNKLIANFVYKKMFLANEN